MKIETINAVSYNTGRVVGNSTGIVVMEILGFNHVCKPNATENVHTIEVEYKYEEKSIVVGVPNNQISQGVFRLNSATEINDFHTQVKTMLPAFTTKTKAFEDEIIIGAKVEFAKTFGILMTDLKTV